MESNDTKVVDFSTASLQKDDDEITLVETLVNIKKSVEKYKGKAIMQESEPPKKITKKEMIQITLDEEIAQRFYEEEKAQLLMDEEYAQPVKITYRVHRPKKKDIGCKKSWEEKKYSFEEIKMLFNRTIESIRKFVQIESEGQIADSKAGEGSSKVGESLERPAEKELGLEHQKRQKVKEDLSQERLQQMMVIIPKQEIYVEDLQTKYPIINWEINIEGTRQYWKIIRVGNITEVHKFFVDMIKAFDREDLVKLWSLVKERFNLSNPTEDK
nr:hypothetical protein [Tanacetum cinerariifolium]